MPEPQPEPEQQPQPQPLPADPCLSHTWPPAAPAAAAHASFRADGYTILPEIVPPELAARLGQRLERVLRGEFDTGQPPDKRPKFRAEERVKPGKRPPALGGPSKRTLQVINIWKADRLFASVVRSPALARLVAQLGGWRGARVANDQVWAKPPGAAPITFHRDSTYFDFSPPDVITVWLALDTMTPELGTLEYVRGSHAWGDERRGSAQQFFDTRDNRALLDDAARKEGIADPQAELEVRRVEVSAGGGSVHNGRLWHGSGPNASKDLPRRGLGIHFVPAEARFRDDTDYLGKLFAPHKVEGSLDLPDAAFPCHWLPPES